MNEILSMPFLLIYHSVVVDEKLEAFWFQFIGTDRCRLNKRLVKGFLRNAKTLLKEEKGEIHISHKDGDPYNKWDLVKKAEKIGLVLQESVPFCKRDYPGYQNKRAHGSCADDPFPLGNCTTFKFRLKSSNS